jgi:serine/threonine protein phosphatase PrpC
VNAFRWSGSEAHFIDQPFVVACGPVAIGRYGGHSAAGAHKNEDAALVWCPPAGAWVFAALLDAHGSAESADLLLAHIAEQQPAVTQLLTAGADTSLWELTALFARALGDEAFRRACAAVRGETACLLCAQKGAYLWWLSVGDVSAYVFHPEFARLGQFAVNQRMFYEWVGQVNTFALPVPCYATGVRQLRPGRNHILLATDGLLECGARRLEDPRTLYDRFGPERTSDLGDAMSCALAHVLAERGRDSATVIAWAADGPSPSAALLPSA